MNKVLEGAQPQPEGNVTARISYIDATVESLWGEIRDLELRLSFILRPEGPKESAVKGSAQSVSMSPAADRLEGLVDQMRSQVGALRNIIERIEL